MKRLINSRPRAAFFKASALILFLIILTSKTYGQSTCNITSPTSITLSPFSQYEAVGGFSESNAYTYTFYFMDISGTEFDPNTYFNTWSLKIGSSYWPSACGSYALPAGSYPIDFKFSYGAVPCGEYQFILRIGVIDNGCNGRLGYCNECLSDPHADCYFLVTIANPAITFSGGSLDICSGSGAPVHQTITITPYGTALTTSSINWNLAGTDLWLIDGGGYTTDQTYTGWTGFTHSFTYPGVAASNTEYLLVNGTNFCSAVEIPIHYNLVPPPAAPTSISFIPNSGNCWYTPDCSPVSTASYYLWSPPIGCNCSSPGTSVTSSSDADPALHFWRDNNVSLCVQAGNACGLSPSYCVTDIYVPNISGCGAKTDNADNATIASQNVITYTPGIVHLQLPTVTPTQFMLYNTIGQNCMNESVSGNKDINLSGLSSGVYIVILKQGGNIIGRQKVTVN